MQMSVIDIKRKKVKNIFINEKMKRIIYYGIAGVCTTIISFATFKLFLILNVHYIPAFSLSWIIAVTFAYITTRKKVYNSNKNNIKGILIEYNKFIIGRIFTYFVNLVLLSLAVEMFKLDEFYSNVVITILVIILNYIIGDFTINKMQIKRKNKKGGKDGK